MGVRGVRREKEQGGIITDELLFTVASELLVSERSDELWHENCGGRGAKADGKKQ